MKQNYVIYHRIVIDNAATLLNWAKTVQSDLIKWVRPRCDYQDDYAHTSTAVIDKAFNDATPDDRRLILCAIYNTMDYSEVERLLLVRAKEVRRIERAELYRDFDQMEQARNAELDKREAAIIARENTFKSAMKPYHKRLADQRRTVDRLTAELATAQDRATAARKEANTAKLDALEYEIKAARYDAIRGALVLTA